MRPAGTLRLGTRGSVLALTQSRIVAAAVERTTGREVELVEIVTPGDRSSMPVPELGVGVFVSALREALATGEIDFAVHSYKDLPTGPVEDLVIVAVPPREDPRDALVARDGLTLAELPPGSRIGTGAPRRMAQVAALGLGFATVAIRGNVDTRIAKVTSGELDAVILARAGLARLGRLDEITETLDPLTLLPAPAQGALAVECRSGDVGIVEALGALDHPATRAAVVAERALLAALEAGCSAPVGGLAEVTEDEEIYLRGAVYSLDGSFTIRLSATGKLTDAEDVGRRLAADLLAEGANNVLGVQHDPHP